MKIPVVYNIKTLETYPFIYGERGEVIITSNKHINMDNVRVCMTDASNVDWETGLLKERING